MTLPVLIHGDSAFPGQGIVAETLNLSRLDGYHTDGTIHIIANNQLGFTATPGESYSTSYASGLARGFKIPIVHVNADDPAACLEAARMAWEYRARFHKDFLIDLVGYRRHGHNEGDEPAFTQPVMYQSINAHPTVRELFAESLVKHGTVSQEAADGLVKKHFTVLEQTFASLKPEEDFVAPIPTPAAPGLAAKTQTGVPIELLRDLNESLLSTPEGFHVHKKLERVRDRKRAMLANADERTVDWGGAEELAFASILADGVPIRLTGEDVQRGTFSHRHAVLHDAESRASSTCRCSSCRRRARSFEIHNSPLTEAATIGFEFGYNMQEPEHLVIWEAQYGDFINGAQIILDQFVTSGRAKWGLKPSLVFLLPHGYEGQGPEHSSARPERFLQAAADINLRLVNCTTAAQYFHVLRRQAALLEKDPLPLIVLTPKSLLRHPAVSSTPQELTEGHFRSVLDDADALTRAKSVRRLVLCSGKVYVDLIGHERRAEREGRGDLPRGAALSVPQRRAARGARALSVAHRGGVGAGRAVEHGRVGIHVAAARGADRRPLRPALHRPRAQLEPVRGILGVAPGQSEDARRAGVRPRDGYAVAIGGVVEADAQLRPGDRQEVA